MFLHGCFFRFWMGPPSHANFCCFCWSDFCWTEQNMKQLMDLQIRMHLFSNTICVDWPNSSDSLWHLSESSVFKEIWPSWLRSENTNRNSATVTCFEQPLHFNLEVFGGINQISKAGQEICGLGEMERFSNWKDAFQDKRYWSRTSVPRHGYCSSYLSNSCTRDLSLRSACPHRQKNPICFQCVGADIITRGFLEDVFNDWRDRYTDILYIPQGRISSCSIGCLYCLDRQKPFPKVGSLCGQLDAHCCL